MAVHENFYGYYRLISKLILLTHHHWCREKCFMECVAVANAINISCSQFTGVTRYTAIALHENICKHSSYFARAASLTLKILDQIDSTGQLFKYFTHIIYICSEIKCQDTASKLLWLLQADMLAYFPTAVSLIQKEMFFLIDGSGQC